MSLFPRKLKWIAIGLSALLMSAPLYAAPLQPGDMAPVFALPDSKGNTHTLTEFRGQRVVLEWTNHDCPFVRKHYDSGNMQSTQLAARAEGAVWLSIISSAPGKQGFVTAEQANELTKERRALPTAVLLDPEGEVGRLYEAKTTPQMFIISPEGNIEYMGAIDDRPSSDPADIQGAHNHVVMALEELGHGKQLSVKHTAPYGCGVKY